MDKIDLYIQKKKQWTEELTLLRSWLNEFSELKEELKWGAPVYTVDGKNVIGIGAFKAISACGFFRVFF